MIDFSKLKKAKMSDVEKKAKLSSLDVLKSQIMDMIKGDMPGMKKVTVASDSPEGVEEGLEKAKDMLSKHDESEESVEEEAAESPEQQEEVGMEESPEERIARLEKELAELKARK